MYVAALAAAGHAHASVTAGDGGTASTPARTYTSSRQSKRDSLAGNQAGDAALTAAAARHDAKLVASLAKANSGEQVLQMLAQGRAPAEPPTRLSSPVAVTGLQSLARFSRQRAWVRDARVAALLAAVGAHAASLPACDAAKCAWALARLGAAEPWLPALLQASKPDTLPPRELSLLIWAVGSLRARPSAVWQAGAWAALALALPSCNPRDCGMAAYGLGAAGAAPPTALKVALERASAAHLAAFSPCELAHVLFGFTAWGADEPPSEQWARLFWVRATAEAGRDAFAPRELANLLHAAAVLRAPLSPTTLDVLEAATGARLGDFAPRDLANSVWALCKVNRVPTEAWLDAFVAEARRKLPTFKARELSVMLWALADLSHRPSDAWLAAFFACSLPHLREATPQALANLVWAVAVLDAPPPEAWMEAFAARMLAVVHLFTRQGLALCCWALVVLQAYRCAALPAAWALLLQQLQAADVVGFAGDDVDDVDDMIQLERCQIDLRTVYEVAILAATEAPGLLPAPAASVLDAARTTWQTETAAQASAGITRGSRTYKEVAICLRESLLLAPSEQVVCATSGRIVDLALEQGGLRLAVQVDGPNRFLCNTWQPSGATRLRDRALAASGWRVLSLPFYTLDELRTAEPRAEYLRRRLSEASLPLEGA